jgi:hypothetical protein
MRVCLEDGLKLDLNQLVRDGIVVPGVVTAPRTTFWQVAGSRDVVAVAVITAIRRAHQFFYCCAEDVAESYRRLLQVLKVGDDLCDPPPFESVSTWR